MVYDRNLIRFYPKQEKSFGTIEVQDPVFAKFEAYEIVFHTPAEHFITGK